MAEFRDTAPLNVFAALLNSITRIYRSLVVCKETLCLLILTLIKQVSKGKTAQV